MPAEIPFRECHLCGQLSGVLIWSDTHHWLFWFWVHLGGVPMQVDVTLLCVSVLGLSFWSYHAIYYLWLCLLGLGMCGRG